MTINSIINGKQINTIPVCDRGFHYGDGLFETIAYKNGKLLLWDEHLSRLSTGCKKLGLVEVAEKKWLDDIKQLITNTDNAVVKLILTRGCGGRGYLQPQKTELNRMVSVYPWPNYPDSHFTKGVKVFFCDTPASINTALAGLKHLNKLENVIARNEWSDSAIAEGLMSDSNKYIIEGTMSNVFGVKEDLLFTPKLNNSGVKGVVRERVIETAKKLGIDIKEINLNKKEILEMDELFLTNSLIGIWPVRKIENMNYKTGQITKDIINLLDMEEGAREL
jgi:4-amino-4-deoxychorismate lyase